MKGSIKKGIGIASIGLLAILSLQSHAAGYRVEFQSTSVLADGGDAAVVEDAGTNWYNAAGLVYLPQQYVFSLIDVYSPVRFSGNVNAPSTTVPVPPFTFSANGKASSHPNSQLPAIHYTYPLKDSWAFGISLVPAWGFTEDYGVSSIVRYDLTRVYTKTIMISPSISWKLNNQWSFAAGPDFHYWSVISKSQVNTAPITVHDSVSRFSADNWGYGAHMGILFRPTEKARIGLNYRTKILMDLDGFSDFALTGISASETNSFRLRIPLPPTTTLSAYYDVTPCWALMGTLAFDQWSIVNNYHAQNVATPTVVLPVVDQPQHMRNTLDVSMGTHVKLNEQWLLRGSFKYQPTPTINSFRDINFPDGRKLGLQVGSRYQMTKQLALDLIYGHVFVKTAPINGVNPLSGATAIGQARTTIDFAGAQIVWNI